MAPCLLAVFAHPDDESFGPGGTLAKYAAQGVEITLLVATRREGSSIGQTMEHGSAGLGAIREQELRLAASVLGIREVKILEYPDTALDRVDPYELRSVIQSVMEELNPQVVLTFDPGGITGNPDHIAVSRATAEAFQEMRRKGTDRGSTEPRLYYWVIPEAIVALLRHGSDIPFVGTRESAVSATVDIGEFRERQWQAIRCHRSQSDPVPEVLKERLKAQAGKEFFALAGSDGPIERLDGELSPLRSN